MIRLMLGWMQSLVDYLFKHECIVFLFQINVQLLLRILLQMVHFVCLILTKSLHKQDQNLSRSLGFITISPMWMFSGHSLIVNEIVRSIDRKLEPQLAVECICSRQLLGQGVGHRVIDSLHGDVLYVSFYSSIPDQF